MSKISFVYFDVGGVVVQDSSGNNKRHEMFEFIGVPQAREKEFETYFDQIEIESTRGVDIDSFIEDLRSKFNVTIPPTSPSIRCRLRRAQSFPMASHKQAQSHCPIGLLTDINPHL